MLYINKITNSASQQMVLTGIPGVQIDMTLRFMPRVQRWIMGVTYNDFSCQGVAVVNSLNILRQYENVLPFGICCIRADGLDPYQIGDFQDLSSNLYLLDQADIATINEEWFS